MATASKKSKSKSRNIPPKVPAFMVSLLWGDFLLGLSFIIFSAIITVQFFQDLVRPAEDRQWALLFAPVILVDILMILLLSIFLIEAPRKIVGSTNLHQLRQRLSALLVVNGLAVFWTLYNHPYHYAFVAEIITAVLIVLNIMSLLWTRSLKQK